MGREDLRKRSWVVALNPDWVSFLADLFSPCLGFLKKHLFICGCTGSFLLHTGVSLLQRAGPTLRCSARAPGSGFSGCDLWAR